MNAGTLFLITHYIYLMSLLRASIVQAEWRKIVRNGAKLGKKNRDILCLSDIILGLKKQEIRLKSCRN